MTKRSPKTGVRSPSGARTPVFGYPLDIGEVLVINVEYLMSRKISELQLQYITDEAGKKTAVILPIEEFEELLEDLADLAVIAERRDEPTISHEKVIAKLKRDGLLPD